jgi:hypothetical protein
MLHAAAGACVSTQVVTAIIRRGSDGKLLLVKRSDQVKRGGLAQGGSHSHLLLLLPLLLLLHCGSPELPCRSAATSGTGAA